MMCDASQGAEVDLALAAQTLGTNTSAEGGLVPLVIVQQLELGVLPLVGALVPGSLQGGQNTAGSSMRA